MSIASEKTVAIAQLEQQLQVLSPKLTSPYNGGYNDVSVVITDCFSLLFVLYANSSRSSD